jgi:cold shock CspA family protein
MSKSKETFNKREKEKKRQQQRQEKKDKMEQRRGNDKNKSMDDMIAYVDENGNLSSTPPDPKKRKVFTLEEVPNGVPDRVAEEPSEVVRTGVVDYYNEAKGFGFIVDQGSGERVFVHASQHNEHLSERDSVQFELERNERGWSAVKVRKIS